MPAFEPTDSDRHKVMMLVVCGVAPDRIAGHMGLSQAVLQDHFADETENGNDIANAAVAGSLYRSAVEGTVSAQIFWLKTVAGWSGRQAGDVNFGRTMDAVAGEVAASDREIARRIAYVLDRATRNEGPESI
ncbi:MAG: hypothetical protein ACR2PG_08670 [Hyphomicrobiaceae bacterium]